MKVAKENSKYEQKLQRVEQVLREEGISIHHDHITFDDGTVYKVGDYELMCGTNPDIVALPREDDSCKMILQEYLENN